MRFTQKLQYAHNAAPNKYLIQTVHVLMQKFQFGKMISGIIKRKLRTGIYMERGSKYLHPKYSPFAGMLEILLAV